MVLQQRVTFVLGMFLSLSLLDLGFDGPRLYRTDFIVSCHAISSIQLHYCSISRVISYDGDVCGRKRMTSITAKDGQNVEPAGVFLECVWSPFARRLATCVGRRVRHVAEDVSAEHIAVCGCD